LGIDSSNSKIDNTLDTPGELFGEKNIWSNNNETQDSGQYYHKFQSLKEKNKKKPNQIFIPNKNYDYSADTDEYGCTDELTSVTNKISSINIRNNNINQIDKKSKELLEGYSSHFRPAYTEPDFHPGSFYSGQNSQTSQTPKKIVSINKSYMFPHIVNRSSMVSQTTTQYSSNNKKTYGDTSIEHFESEEK
jgi:hypothetical protein